MSNGSVGIHDIALYVPTQRIPLDVLKKERGLQVTNLERHLDRALRTTGQRGIRFPAAGEDSITLAADSALRLLERPGNHAAAKTLRYVVAGTESGLDHSKPMSSWVQGMLAQAGIDLGTSLSSFQVQHACAGASLALLSILSLLQNGRSRDESGLVLASDIARYETSGTAEITQGSGSAAILAGNDPKLLEFNMQDYGLYSKDVDDFFRPLGSITARVNGRYSMECYKDALDGAVKDFAKHSGTSVTHVLDDHDAFVLHAPFKEMPRAALVDLLGRNLGMDTEAAGAYLAGKIFEEGVDPVADIGNTYTASIFIVLSAALDALRKRFGRDIAGKKLLIASYGSGNTMLVMSATVVAGAERIIEAWKLDTLFADFDNVDWPTYAAWADKGEYATALASEPTGGKNRFYLSQIREDGYRVYSHRKPG